MFQVVRELKSKNCSPYILNFEHTCETNIDNNQLIVTIRLTNKKNFYC